MSNIGFTQSVSTLQYLRVAVSAIVNGNASYNPTADTVQFGFVNETSTSNPQTAPSSWSTASWETVTVGLVPTYVAKCLVGPAGTFVPVVGNYWVWIKITDSPEIPVLFVGELKVT